MCRCSGQYTGVRLEKKRKSQPASRVKEAHTAFDSWYVTDKPKLGTEKNGRDLGIPKYKPVCLLIGSLAF